MEGAWASFTVLSSLDGYKTVVAVQTNFLQLLVRFVEVVMATIMKNIKALATKVNTSNRADGGVTTL